MLTIIKHPHWENLHTLYFSGEKVVLDGDNYWAFVRGYFGNLSPEIQELIDSEAYKNAVKISIIRAFHESVSSTPQFVASGDREVVNQFNKYVLKYLFNRVNQYELWGYMVGHCRLKSISKDVTTILYKYEEC